MSKPSVIESALQSVLKVKPGEGVKVAVMFLYSLTAVGGAYVIGRSVSRALFISKLPARDLPYRFIGMALGVALGAMLYARFAVHVRRDKLIIGTHVVMALGVLVFRGILGLEIGESFAARCGLFIYCEVIAALMNIQFWTFAADIFNPREAKRLFGLVAAGGVLSNVVAGALLKSLTKVVETADLLYVLVGCMVSCVACVWHLTRDPKLQQQFQRALHPATRPVTQTFKAPAEKPKSKSLLDEMRLIRRSPQLVSIIGIITITALVTNINDYQLDLTLKSVFHDDEKKISAYMGDFFLKAGIAACAVQVFLTGRILERYGILAALALLPIGLTMGSAAVAITGGALWSVFVTRSADVAFRYTVNDSAVNLLYVPVSADFRPRAKAIVDGIFKPISIGLSGLLFLALKDIRGLSVVTWSLISLPLILGWGYLVWKARAQYMRALADNLKNRQLDFDASAVDPSDPQTERVLVAALRGNDPQQILHAVEIVRRATRINWDPHIAPLLRHRSPDVRVAALNYLGRPDNTAFADAVLELFKEPDVTVRAAAIEAYCAMGGYRTLQRVTPFLEDPDATVQSSTVAALIKHGGLDGILLAAEKLKSMLQSENADRRLCGTQVLAKIRVKSFYHPLIPLFEDPDVKVQLGAVRAAAAMKTPELLSFVLHKLGDQKTAFAAADALVEYGAGIEPQLIDVMKDPDISVLVRGGIPRILQRIGTPAAVKALLDQLGEPEEHVRSAICTYLAKLRMNLPEAEIDEARVRQAVLAEIGAHYTLAIVREDLRSEPQGGLLLDEALEVRLDRCFARILNLLSIIYPAEAMRSVKKVLETGLAPTKATAIELLDNLLDREMAKLLLPIIEATPEKRHEIGAAAFGLQSIGAKGRLRELARCGDPWLESIALHRVGELGLTQFVPEIERGLASPDVSVREAALVAARRVLPADALRQHLVTQVRDDRFPTLQRLARVFLQMVGGGNASVGTTAPVPVT
jgi:HEAT repeat protein